MARKKRNRCGVKSCTVVIGERYHFCYNHRKWSLHDVQEQFNAYAEQKEKAKAVLKRFYCDPCGTVFHKDQTVSKLRCTLCGSDTEPLENI